MSKPKINSNEKNTFQTKIFRNSILQLESLFIRAILIDKSSVHKKNIRAKYQQPSLGFIQV